MTVLFVRLLWVPARVGWHAVLLIAFIAALASPVARAQYVSGVAGQPAAAALPAALASRYQEALRWLAAGAAQRARDLLLEIVQDHPDFAGAWLDLALASYQAGDAVAASEYLTIIRQRFPLTPALERQITLWQNTWHATRPGDAPPAGAPGWQGEVSLDAGYSDNVNGGLSQSSITLTLPGSTALLPLAPESRPQAAAYSQFAAQTWRRFHAAGGTLYPLLRLRWRTHEHAGQYDQADLQTGLLYNSLPDEHDAAWQSSLILQHLRQGGHTLINSQRLALLRVHQRGGCRLSGGSEYERRASPGLPLASQLLWLEGSVACSLGANAGDGQNAQLALTLRGGREYAREKERPGGDNQQLELALHANWPLAPSTQLEAHWQYSRIRDREGYSPLLENNARRQQARSHLQFTLRHALDPRWEARLQLEWQQQTSNLEIFKQRARQISLGVLRAF